jgi:hypothetical protein
MLVQMLIAEADAFVAQWKDLKLPDGRDRIVRHGHGPQRAIQTGVGPVEVRRAKVRDRADVAAEEKIRFTSSILPLSGFSHERPPETAASAKKNPGPRYERGEGIEEFDLKAPAMWRGRPRARRPARCPETSRTIARRS